MLEFKKIDFKNRLFYERFFIVLIVLFNNIFAMYQDRIPYFTDQINHSVYLLDSMGESFQSDIIYNAILLDGTMNIPLGSYFIDNVIVKDTSNHYNYFNWKQGDYLLRDLSIGSRYVLFDSSLVSFDVQGRSFAGKYGLQGPSVSDYNNNSLQNYYLDYKKKYQNSDLNFGIFYHLEDIGLPIRKNEYNNRENESIHLGINYDLFFNDLFISIDYYLNNGLLDYNNHIEYSSDLYLINSKYKIAEFTLESLIYNKFHSSYINDSLYMSNTTNYLNFNLYQESNKNLYKMGFDLFDNKMYLNFNVLYSFGFYKIKLYRENEFYSHFYNGFELINNIQQKQTFHASFSNKLFDSHLIFENSAINDKKNNAIQFKSKILYGENFIDLKYIYNSSNISLINEFAKIGIHISPNLNWTNRYKFFANLNLFYYKTSNNNMYDPATIYYSNQSYNAYNDFLFNNEFGLIVDNFKLTYCINLNSINDFYISENYLSIEPISFFKVEWVFTD